MGFPRFHFHDLIICSVTSLFRRLVLIAKSLLLYLRSDSVKEEKRYLQSVSCPWYEELSTLGNYLEKSVSYFQRDNERAFIALLVECFD